MIINIVNYIMSFMSLAFLSFSINQESINDIKNGITTYEAYLNIPKINLSQPIYAKDSKENDLDKNIIFIESSDTPLTKNGNVIIAGHSGSATVSFFKNLYKLKNGDIIYLEYKDNIYEYIVTKIYKVKKTGKVEIRRDSNVNSLTLITCHGVDSQLVIISNLKNKQKK